MKLESRLTGSGFGLASMFFVTHARRFDFTFKAEGWAVEERTHLTLDQDCDRGRPAHRCWLVRPEGESVAER